MTATTSETAPAGGVVAGWRRWAFAPVDTAPMAALRIACGLLTIGWAISYLPDADTFLAADGVTRRPVPGLSGWWTLMAPHPVLLLAGLAVAAVALTVGWHTRIAAVLVAVGLVWLQRRDVYVLDGGDLLLRELAILVALMPAGECWSLDARRRVPALRAPWALRLLQLQVSCLYLFSLLAKLHGDAWQNGTAVGIVLQVGDLQRFAVPMPFATSVLVAGLLTYGTLVAEASLVAGLWFPRARWWVLAVGISLHLGIELTLLTGWFSLTVIACYLAFVPGADLRRGVARVRRRTRSP